MRKKILSLILLSVALAGLPNCEKNVKAVTFSDICLEENQAIVSIKGYLRLPTAVDTAVNRNAEIVSYRLVLVEQANGAGGVLPVWADNSKNKTPNRVAELPLSYTYSDFRIFTDEG